MKILDIMALSFDKNRLHRVLRKMEEAMNEEG
jgi:hypothetical protein